MNNSEIATMPEDIRKEFQRAAALYDESKMVPVLEPIDESQMELPERLTDVRPSFNRGHNIYIIYHQVKEGIDCPDGIMAAAIALMDMPDAILQGDVYRNITEYEQQPDPVRYPFKPGDSLCIVDFSYPEHWLRYWEEKGIKVVVIDHHAAKFPMLGNFENTILDADECGATLAWKAFSQIEPSHPMPDLLVHVRRRDIGADGYYQGQTPDSEVITEGLAAFRALFETAEVRAAALGALLLDPDASTMMLNLGRPLIEERDRLVAQAAARATEADLNTPIGRFRVPFVQLLPEEDQIESAVGNLLAKRQAEQPKPILFAWIKTSDGTNSLRSIPGGSDVSVIATAMGGGGHPRAAGWRDVKQEDSHE